MTLLRIIHILIKMMEVTLELSDHVVMQSNTQGLVYSIKNLAIGLQLSKL